MTPQTRGLHRHIGDDLHVRHDGKRVHLVDQADATVALCGAQVKPWSRPDPWSDVHDGCAAKAQQ